MSKFLCTVICCLGSLNVSALTINNNDDAIATTNIDSEHTYYVAPNGDDNNDGSLNSAFATLSKAASKAQPGDTIKLASGRYKQAQAINKLKGSANEPIIIEGSGAIFDGTIDITGGWQKHNANIYKTQVNNAIWQLFINEEMVMSARWPNAQLKDGSLWDMKRTWRHQAPTSTFGHMIDERPYENIQLRHKEKRYIELPVGVNTQSLANSGIDATGAIAIMNIGSWLNWAQVVEKHVPGSNSFTYSRDFSKSGKAMYNAANSMLANKEFWQLKNQQYEEGHYYLEGKLALLDSPNEWFFDPITKTVYLWASNNADPNTLQISGKHRDYALTINDSSYIQIEGLQFFASAFTVINSHNIVFKDIKAKYYAYSRRMLGDLTRPQTIKFHHKKTTTKPTNNAILDSTLAYTDGPAFEFIQEYGDIIDNNLIHNIDYSNLGTGAEGSLNMAANSHNITFSNNTFHTAGNSEGVRVGAASKVIGNHIYNTSLLQHDGAAINVGVKQQANTEIAFNWVHDSAKAGIRFDGVKGASKVGSHGLVHHNVVWNTQTSIIKGDYQGTYNNLMFNNRIADLVIFNNPKAGGFNLYSETTNNLVGHLQGRKSGNESQLTVPGINTNNLTYATSNNILEQLRGVSWGDFRPVHGATIIDNGTINTRYIRANYLGLAPDIGAYEYGDAHPWIPGHRDVKATNPVPFNNSTMVAVNLDLMFKHAQGDWQYQVYLGTNKDALDYIGNANFTPLSVAKLTPASRYFWRVDMHHNSEVRTGDTWSFTTVK